MAAKRILFISRSELVSPLHAQFKAHDCQAMVVEDRASALKVIEGRKADLVFTLPSLPGYRAQDLLETVQQSGNPLPVIVFTDKGSADEARLFMELGAQDYWLCPLTWEKVQAALPADAPSGPATPVAPPQGKPREVSIIGRHPAVMRVLALARQVAASKATVLISGESGTGKEMFARFIHAHSGRENGPFVAVNCAALPEHLLESELFGYVGGAFTGGLKDGKAGLFEVAGEGTVFLDEIGDMPLSSQAKLLRVMQDHCVRRIGGSREIPIRARIITATNRNLEKMVEDGSFRQDLYYRINVLPIHIPPLQERPGDIGLLAEHFLFTLASRMGRPAKAIAPEGLAKLRAHHWPGNVRELKNVMDRAAILCPDDVIGERFVILAHELGDRVPGQAAPAVRPEPGQALKTQLDRLEKDILESALKRARSVRQAALTLGLSHTAMLNKIRKHGLRVTRPLRIE